MELSFGFWGSGAIREVSAGTLAAPGVGFSEAGVALELVENESPEERELIVTTWRRTIAPPMGMPNG